ncbi:MAG: hypothetical protein J5J06_15930 [Phycisphaerae bacterium]|nr:hypothetical protein [Phycisphaerae bacterium]
MSIIHLAFHLEDTVKLFVAHARRFYYEVMLSGRVCPGCSGQVTMTDESRCRCLSCGQAFDPTVAFQSCVACGGSPHLRIRRYRCRRCSAEVHSQFVFDTLPFDREYFRRRMAESRERKRQQPVRARPVIADGRSGAVAPPAVELHAVPGLVEALDGLVGSPQMAAWLPLAKGFDLSRYQAHLEAHIGPIEVYFDDLPPLEENARLDRVWRSIAIIFMAHFGLIEITRYARGIVVMRKDEADREGS